MAIKRIFIIIDIETILSHSNTSIPKKKKCSMVNIAIEYRTIIRSVKKIVINMVHNVEKLGHSQLFYVK